MIVIESISGLLKAIAVARPQVGSLIQTILELGAFAGSGRGFTVNESGEPTLSLPTIVRAMEVLDDFSKTKDYTGRPSAKVIHAYGLVERAIREQHSGGWELVPRLPTGPAPVDRLAGDLGGGSDGDPADSGGDPPSGGSQLTL